MEIIAKVRKIEPVIGFVEVLEIGSSRYVRIPPEAQKITGISKGFVRFTAEKGKLTVEPEPTKEELA
jgi:hypothetical protein